VQTVDRTLVEAAPVECVGVVDDAGGTDLAVGQTVAALMGEMGRAYDGGYMEENRGSGKLVVVVE
jgi:hypothetical protein